MSRLQEWALHFASPCPLSPLRDETPCMTIPVEVQSIREKILEARDTHAALLDDSPQLDKFVRSRMRETGERSYSAALAEVVAIAREVRTLAAQFEDASIDDAEVARVATAHAEAQRKGATVFSVLREADRG